MAHEAIPTVVADSLALAVVAASEAPTLLLDGDFAVVAASSSFLRAFKSDLEAVQGRAVFTIGAGEWDLPQLRSFLNLTLTEDQGVDGYEMELRPPDGPRRRLVITARVLHYADPANVRVLMAVADVTEARLAARLKDQLLHEKTVLHQELQHRVANSLQIIASVLLQSARRVPSADAKGYLVDAHTRVMSVAALQQQLAQSKAGDVALRTYLTDLCASIGASMIEDRDKLVLRVEADEGTATADVSVSLGLIVTELVINALKHAFPDGRGGSIVVGYQSDHPPNWALSVTDDGVGIPAKPGTPGLGTGIVEALTKQVGATMEISDAHPGTRVSIVRED
jgi:two-component sensor histidine kinase